MLAVIAFHEGDRTQAREQAEWIRDLGGVKAHECLLVPAINCDAAGIVEPLREAFGKVQVLPMWEEAHGWPRGANITWANIAQHISNPHPKALPAPQPWLWLEPDAVPLKPDWLDRLAAEYATCGKPVLAAEVDHTADGGRRYTSGVAVYPINTPFLCGEKILDINDPAMNEAFDPYFRDEFLPNAHLTKLIQHVWVTSRNPDVLPTFPDQASLRALWPEAVLFHRVKDGSLVRQLRVRQAFDVLRNAGEEIDRKPTLPTVEEALREEIARLKAQLCTPTNGPTAVSSASPTAPANRRRARAAKKSKRLKPPTKRSPEQVEEDRARMAKVRAAKLAKT